MGAKLGKEEIAGILESIALLLELKGENPFKIRAYVNAARALEDFPGDLAKWAEEKRLEEIPGVGKAIADKVGHLALEGRLPFYEDLKAAFPPTIFELFELQGLGAKKVKALHEQLGVSSIEQLEAACSDGRVAGLSGFGEKSAENFLKAIEQRKEQSGVFRLGDIAVAAEAMLEELRSHPAVTRVSIAGSYRRRKETVHDLDFIVSSRKPEEVMDFFTGAENVANVVARGPTKASVLLKTGIQADLRVVKDAEFPFALSYFTGSKEHNIVMRGRALDHGWTLNEYRLAPVEKKGRKPDPIPEVHSEGDLYQALGLSYVEPELREDRGEFAAAEKGDLPALISLENLRGTFHCHTTASDGHASLDEMADAARELGLQYLGIADHSKSSFQAHGLSVEQLQAQRKAIDALNEREEEAFRVFAGVECDILKDGKLDYPDDVLAELDYVVASVHAVFNLPEAEMTKRIIRAISNPYVTMLGHLTGRLLLTREPYKVNIPAVIEAAVDTGTIIELNANPRRLDMDWRWWPLAREKGVKCAINPDAHRPAGFQDLWFGVAMARKGWLTKRDVINCLPLGKIEAVLNAKRDS